MKRLALLVGLNIIPLFLISQSLERGVELLNTGNYAEASEVFRHILQKENDNPAAQYGMAKTFFMKDNPQYNLDSANYYVLQSAGGLKKEWKPGELKKFQEAGWREYNVTDLQLNINNEAYRVADENNSIDGWNHFITNYITSSQMHEAIERRNTLAFTAALESNDYQSFEDFLNTYPDAEQTDEARALYEKLLYQTKTKDSTWQVYDSFIKNFPNSPYIGRAKENYERLLFLDKTKSQLLADYILFTRDFPQSPYIAMAEDR